MRRKILGIICAGVISSFVYAEAPLPVPAAPILDNLKDRQACETYTDQMTNYLQSLDPKSKSSFNNMFNAAWFKYYGGKENYHDSGEGDFGRTDEQCIGNNVCSVKYYGSSVSGCDMAVKIANDSPPKHTLLDKLTTAYDLAIRGDMIPVTLRQFSFSGNKGVCTYTNQYRGCNLGS